MLVSEAAKDLKINLSTAKFIVKSFKKNGRVMKKKTD
jgi:transposase